MVVKHIVSVTQGNIFMVVPDGLEYLANGSSNLTVVTLEQIVLHAPTHEYSTIIIHELYFDNLVVIKRLVSSVKPRTVWVVNCLPLPYYLSSDSPNNHSITISQIFTLMNIWVGFDLKMKKRHKTDIINTIYTRFDRMYRLQLYHKPIASTRRIIPLDPYERDLRTKIWEKFEIWKSMLTISTSALKMNKLETRMYNTLICLMTNTLRIDNIAFHFSTQIDRTITTILTTITKLDALENLYSAQANTKSVISYDKTLSEIAEYKSKCQSLNANYQRYRYMEPKHGLECPICYATDEASRWSYLICGHVVCYECILQVLANSNKCPICMEYITVTKMTIASMDYQSSLEKTLAGCIRQTEVVVLTNLSSMMTERFMVPYKVVDFTKKKVGQILRNLSKQGLLSTIAVVVKNPPDVLYRILHWIKLMRPSGEIIEIELKI